MTLKQHEFYGPIPALLRLGSRVEPRLRQELRRSDLSLEVRRRIERVVQHMPEPVASAEVLRELRAIHVLERVGTPGALILLESLTKGAAEGILTQAATDAHQRLSRRHAAAR